MSWVSKKRFKILFIISIIPLCIISYSVYTVLSEKPTCFDQKQNGIEQGIDCGGGCKLQCLELMQDISVRWSRAFKINESLYNVGAYIENQNTGVGVEKIKYEFKVYDKDRLLIARREGETFIAPNQGMLIFEEQLKVGNSIPVYTNFEFIGKPTWYKLDSRFSELVIQIKDKFLNTDDIRPRLSAVLKNLSEKQEILGVDVLVVLFNQDDTAIQIGKTTLGTLPPLSEKNIFVTWPEQFTTTPVRFEIYPKFNPFSQKFVK